MVRFHINLTIIITKLFNTALMDEAISAFLPLLLSMCSVILMCLGLGFLAFWFKVFGIDSLMAGFYLALKLLTSILLASWALTTFANQDAKVAVASNFLTTAKLLINDFENRPRNTDYSITPVFASSGKLYAQIAHGAPFDALLSADQDKPKRLLDKNLAVNESLYSYAVGHLYLEGPTIKRLSHVSLRDNEQSPSDDSVNNFKDILFSLIESEKGLRIAIANPKFAPYGAAAIEALKAVGLCNNLSCRPPLTLIQGENINQVYQFLYSGAATAGFIAGSQRSHDSKAIKVPQSLHAPIVQDAVLLNRGENNAAARAFLNYLAGERAKKIIRQQGYAVNAVN